MRHLIGIALAVVMAVALFFGGAWGYLRLLRLPAPPVPLSGLPAGGGSLLSNSAVLTSLAAVFGTAVLAAVLIGVPRISPLAAGLPGLLLIGWTALYLTSVRRGVDLIPLKYHAFGAGFEAMLFNGVLGAAGLVMVVPLFLPSRWRARGKPLDSEMDEDEVSDEEVSEFVSSLGEAAVSADAAEARQATQSRPAAPARQTAQSRPTTAAPTQSRSAAPPTQLRPTRPPAQAQPPKQAQPPRQPQPPWDARPGTWPPSG